MKLLKCKSIIFIVILILMAGAARSAPMYNVPMTLTQPDGSQIHCYASGDEFHNWLHDENGYTIIQHPKTGFYVYALQDGDNVKASDFLVGQVNPQTEMLTPNVNLAESIVDLRRSEYEKKLINPEVKKFSAKKSANALSNVVVYIKFADETLPDEQFSYYNDLYLNADGPSLIHYYREVSYNQIDVNTTFIPAPAAGLVVWYTDTHARGYYQPYNASTNPNGYDPDASGGETGRTFREHKLLNNAITALGELVPADFEVDANGDGYVDCVSFIVSGGPDAWAELLWPHRWSLFSYTNYIHGKRVYDYTFQLQFTSTSQTSRVRLGTVAHEMFHVIGAPDLYRYTTTDISPVAQWDLMASTGNMPQKLTAYMKYLYGGWLQNIPDITESGTYILNPLDLETQNCFRIPSGKSHTEYYVVEYRRKLGLYDSSLPGSGLLVSRINEREVGIGNAQGPPDELYIFRPNGGLTVNGNSSQANFSSTVGRTVFNDLSNPAPFLSNGTIDDVNILDIGASGSTIDFSVQFDYEFQRAVNYINSFAFPSSLNLPNSQGRVPVSVRLTPDELSAFVGNYITKVEFYVGKGTASTLYLRIYEGTENNAPKKIVYSQNIISEVSFRNFNLHTLISPIKIKAATDYWVGYELITSGSFPIGVDPGPIVPEKGGWIRHNEVWKQLTVINANYSNNLLINTIIQNLTPTSVESNEIYSSTNKSTSYPNPFSESTTIDFVLNMKSHVSIKVYNVLGQEVRNLVSETKDAGNYKVELNGDGLPAGVYFYQIKLNNNPSGVISNKIIKY